MSKGLYWAYVKAWVDESPASKYNLSPGAALMLRDIIDYMNSKYWPSSGCRINNDHFYESCNFKNREMIRKCRDELMKANLITWHRDESNKNKPGFYQLTWKPAQVKQEMNEVVKESSCQVYLTATASKLRVIKA